MSNRVVKLTEMEEEESIESQAPKSVPAWIFVVVLSIVIAFVTALVFLVFVLVQKNSDKVEQLESEIVSVTENSQQKEDDRVVVPVLYATDVLDDKASSELRAVDPQSGNEEVVYLSDEPFTLYAVPQVGYSGSILLNLSPDAYELWRLDVETQKLYKPARTLELPSNLDAVVLAPDQIHAVAVYDSPYTEGESPKDIVFWNLIDGSRDIKDIVAIDETFSAVTGGANGASGFDISWTSGQCVKIGIFEIDGSLPNSLGETINVFKEYRNFCR